MASAEPFERHGGPALVFIPQSIFSISYFLQAVLSLQLRSFPLTAAQFKLSRKLLRLVVDGVRPILRIRVLLFVFCFVSSPDLCSSLLSSSITLGIRLCLDPASEELQKLRAKGHLSLVLWNHSCVYTQSFGRCCIYIRHGIHVLQCGLVRILTVTSWLCYYSITSFSFVPTAFCAYGY